MGFGGFRWVSVGFGGFRWVSVGFGGFRWVSVGFGGFRWVSVLIERVLIRTLLWITKWGLLRVGN